MSRIRKCLTVAAGAAAGLFLTALASNATAAADTVPPTMPDLPGMFEKALTSSATIPQQLLQTTASALPGTGLAPAAPQTPAPIATATLNMPQNPAGAGLGPAAGIPAGLPAASGLPVPGDLSSVLPFPLPNLGGTTLTVPSATAPGALLAPAAAAPVATAPASTALLPGLP